MNISKFVNCILFLYKHIIIPACTYVQLLERGPLCEREGLGPSFHASPVRIGNLTYSIVFLRGLCTGFLARFSLNLEQIANVILHLYIFQSYILPYIFIHTLLFQKEIVSAHIQNVTFKWYGILTLNSDRLVANRLRYTDLFPQYGIHGGNGEV